MVANVLVESFKVTFAAIWGQSSLMCHNPSSEFAIGGADLPWVRKWVSIVSYHSTLVREDPKLRTPCT